MRTYGRVYGPPDSQGNQSPGPWQVIETDITGYNDAVYATTVLQCLRLNLGESPFYANYGIPAKTSVLQQIAPDYNVALTQKQFAPFFASLVINRQPTPGPTPVYKVSITTQQGSLLPENIPG